MAKGTWTHYFLPRIYPKPQSRQADYIFKLRLLGNRGGFITHNRTKDKIKIFLDSNGDSLFNPGDPKLGSGKVAKNYRNVDELINIQEVGKVRSKYNNACHEQQGIDPCFGFPPTQELTFRTSDGDLIAQLEIPSFKSGWNLSDL